MKNKDLHRILLKGGVTSPGELKDIISMLEAVGLSEVFFGSRQDLLFPLPSTGSEELEKTTTYNTDIISERSYQNIVCSYVTADIFDFTYWLKGSTYLYLLEEFDFLPKLKINITDAKQRLVPVFSGNLNFIASNEEDYWYLYIQLPNWNKLAMYPVLIYSWNIVAVCKAIEEIYPSIHDINQLFALLNQRLQTNNKVIKEPLSIRFVTFPYYEGINRMGIDQYWLGLYWRNNRYDIQFLKEFCAFCLQNGIGKICITPWKSFIVKGIPKECRSELEKFLGLRGINVRHSQLEMNWHLPVEDAKAYDLKNYLVKHFNVNDISTYGLTFGISNDVGKRSHFSSIIIEMNPETRLPKGFKFIPSYNVLHFKNFDPNTGVYEVYAHEVDRSQLSSLLMELSKNYFQQLYTISEKTSDEKPKNVAKKNQVYQCQNCLTIYEESVGDLSQKINPDTLFDNLPDEYKCSVCSATKEAFLKTEIQF